MNAIYRLLPFDEQSKKNECLLQVQMSIESVLDESVKVKRKEIRNRVCSIFFNVHIATTTY